MNENKEERTFKVFCHKGVQDGEYTLNIEARNVHTDLCTWYYDHCSGNSVTFTLHSLSPGEIVNLAWLLWKVSVKVGGEYCSAATEEEK